MAAQLDSRFTLLKGFQAKENLCSFQVTSYFKWGLLVGNYFYFSKYFSYQKMCLENRS
jgi:hypothetical protein